MGERRGAIGPLPPRGRVRNFRCQVVPRNRTNPRGALGQSRPTDTSQRGEGRQETHMTFAILLLLGTLLASGSSAPRPKAPVDDPCWTLAARAELSSRASPLDSTVAQLGDIQVKVCYGRPSARGRVIMGGLVPFGDPWRLGANEATTLHVPVAVRFGDVSLKPGVYSLYAIPGPKTWQIVVNESATRWGIPISAAVRAHDLGAVTATSEHTDAPVETLTVRLDPSGEGALALVIEWERTRVHLTVRRSQ